MKCDFCKAKALYDAKLSFGPWANLCQDCFDKYECSLGLGKGQKLENENE